MNSVFYWFWFMFSFSFFFMGLLVSLYDFMLVLFNSFKVYFRWDKKIYFFDFDNLILSKYFNRSSFFILNFSVSWFCRVIFFLWLFAVIIMLSMYTMWAVMCFMLIFKKSVCTELFFLYSMNFMKFVNFLNYMLGNYFKLYSDFFNL